MVESALTKADIRDKEAKEKSRIEFAEKVMSDHEKSSQNSRRASKRAKIERQKSQEIREAVEEMKQGHFEQVEQFDNSMKEVIERENYRLEMQELAKQDVIKNSGQRAGYFVGKAASKEFEERAKDEVY